MMDKKIIQALYAYIADKDSFRPIMEGVYFEKKCCCASDGHLLVVYNEGKSELDGKTIAKDGSVINGKYPNYLSVFPKDENGTEVDIDFVQLRNACQWQTRQEDSNNRECVVIKGVGYHIPLLLRMLNFLMVTGDLTSMKFINYGATRATVIKGKEIKGLMMPFEYSESNIDSEREEGSGYSKTYSYEGLINDYVFNSWKKPEKKKEDTLSWLD